MTRHKRPDRAKERKHQALIRRKAELADWESGKFSDVYVELMARPESVVARKIETAKEEIAHIEAPFVVDAS